MNVPGMVRSVLLWLVFAATIRFGLIGGFYQDTPYVMGLLTVGLVLHSVLTYYLFGYVLFRYILERRRLVFIILSILIWYLFIHISNYLLFNYLQSINQGLRLDRDWNRLKESGLIGSFSNWHVVAWNLLYSPSVSFIFVGILAVKQVFRYRTENLKLERDNLNLELNFLKAQVNPHFLFNTLNSVYGRVFETDEQAADLVLRLSELMRYSLYEADVPRIALEKELAYIQNYLNLERNRLLNEDVLIEYEQKGEPAGYEIAPLLLIAFVENAFKHGVKGDTEPAYVSVRAEIDNDELRFRVENSVATRRIVSGKSARKLGGVGLPNVRRRLENLYKGRYALDITPKTDSYVVVLRLKP